jgi:hypothetical protein
MTKYLNALRALMRDRRAVTSFDKGVIAGVLALAAATEVALGAMSIH